MEKIVQLIHETPVDRRNLGWQNQLRHAETRLANIRKALLTKPGDRSFPDGRDLSLTLEEKSGTTVLDNLSLPEEIDD